MGISPLLKGYFPEGSFVWLTFCYSAWSLRTHGVTLVLANNKRVFAYSHRIFYPNFKIFLNILKS
jgi:hypothetical protein